MSTSTSDHEMSDCSNSPLSYTTLESPYSSPSQQVPQLTSTLTGLSCLDKPLYNNNANIPLLRIVEQPQNHFRFRYVSEMVGTHGCLLGKSSGNNKTKTHPTVELMNFNGQALMRCRLAQHNTTAEHPHRLQEDEQDREVSYLVPKDKCYRVAFPGMGIIHTAKKDVSNLLFKKLSEQRRDRPINNKELRAECDNLAKAMNLNIVRLKFSAHDVITGKEICEPVFSDPIHNMKSAATNDLKICRISLYSGRPRGGEDVFILVEKVNKKNIMIRFYEEENGERVWEDTASFIPSDVHHQYAIVFRTPPYRDPQTSVDVKVFIELVRPQDGRTSEPVEFTYKAEEVLKQMNKKRKNTNNSYSSLSSSSGGSLTDLPVTVSFNNHTEMKNEPEMPVYQVQLPYQAVSQQCDLVNALGIANNPEMPPSLMWAAPNPVLSSLPHLHLNSTELDTMPRDVSMTEAVFTQENLQEYIESFTSLDKMTDISFIRHALVSDSGRVKIESDSPPGPSSTSPIRPDSVEKKPNLEYPAFYKPEDALEVKKIVTELCEVIRNKKGYKNQEVRAKLDRLFEIRLSNGDTFLHMTLCSNQPSFDSIVKVIHSVRMSHLLNYGNNKKQTILHLAVLNGAANIVSLLVSKGCDPKLKDSEGENAIHYAVKYKSSCLEPLLDAIKKNDVPFDINDCNNEKQSALHLCVLYEAADSAELLISRGASYSVRDAAGRTPLHLCAYDARGRVARALATHTPPSDIDVVDGYGNTALQIVCGRSMDTNSVKMVKLLLEKKADPLKHEDHNDSAWKLCRDKPLIREVMKPYVPQETILEDDVKSEPDDDYESADDETTLEDDIKSETNDDYGSANDDMEGAGLCDLNAYVHEVSARVEAAGAWRELARRLRAEALLSWFQAQPSPARTLLNHVKECRDDITSKSLALILEDMGLNDAANVIRNHIEN